MTDVRNIVLVHGGFVDGSGWRGVYDQLTADGYNVSVVQNQTLSLESDVETTTNMLDLQDGPAILVGHSYGGAVITESGTHDSVAGLVYICAFAPDQGESVSTLLADLPPDGPIPPILPPQDGFLFLDREKFADSFAADVPARDAAFMAGSQVPWGVEALNGTVSEPAWRSKPNWYMVTTEDRMIPPPLQRTMAERAGGDDHRSVRQPRHLRLSALRRRQPGHAGGTVRARRKFRGVSSSRLAGRTPTSCLGHAVLRPSRLEEIPAVAASGLDPTLLGGCWRYDEHRSGS
jgi:pimeloyl-ACP methyl ester carboxylesterase